MASRRRTPKLTRPAFKDTALQRFADSIIELLERRDPT